MLYTLRVDLKQALKEADMMMDFDEQDYLEPLEPFEEEKPQRSFGGLSPVEIGVLVVLLVVICGLAGFIGKSIYDNAVASAETPTPSPTVVFTATVPPDATSTPWPTAASIPDWNKFEFAEGKASLWMPNGFQGGDPIAYPEIVMLTIETYSNDEVFIQSVDDLLSENPEITFFVFDPEVIEWPRVATVSSEKLPSKWLSNKDAYLEDLATDMDEDGNRFIGKEYVVLDNFEAWRLIAELRVPIGDGGYYTYSKMVSYLIPVDDLLWTVTYSTGRDDFPKYWPIIKDSINTFYVQP
jgi:hypothetical protein